MDSYLEIEPLVLLSEDEQLDTLLNDKFLLGRWILAVGPFCRIPLLVDQPIAACLSQPSQLGFNEGQQAPHGPGAASEDPHANKAKISPPQAFGAPGGKRLESTVRLSSLADAKFMAAARSQRIEVNRGQGKTYPA